MYFQYYFSNYLSKKIGDKFCYYPARKAWNWYFIKIFSIFQKWNKNRQRFHNLVPTQKKIQLFLMNSRKKSHYFRVWFNPIRFKVISQLKTEVLNYWRTEQPSSGRTTRIYSDNFENKKCVSPLDDFVF